MINVSRWLPVHVYPFAWNGGTFLGTHRAVSCTDRGTPCVTLSKMLWHNSAHVLDQVHDREAPGTLHVLSNKMKGLAAPEQSATNLFLNLLSPAITL